MAHEAKENQQGDGIPVSEEWKKVHRHGDGTGSRSAVPAVPVSLPVMY